MRPNTEEGFANCSILGHTQRILPLLPHSDQALPLRDPEETDLSDLVGLSPVLAPSWIWLHAGRGGPMTRLLEKNIFLCFCTPCQAVAALLGGPDAMMPSKERLWVLAGGLRAVSVPVGAVQSSNKLSKITWIPER